MIQNGNLTSNTNITATTPYGLRVDVKLKTISEDKPIVYAYTYKLDNIRFQQWLQENEYLCEGPLAFIARGIQVVAVGGSKKWDKTAFSIDSGKEDGHKYFLPLLTQEIKFTVHRDLFSGEEWDVLMDATNIDEIKEALQENSEQHK